MLAVGGWAGVRGYRGARWSRRGYNAAFVGNACRFPEGAAADVHVAFERMVAWGRLGWSSGGAGYGGALGATAQAVSLESDSAEFPYRTGALTPALEIGAVFFHSSAGARAIRS